MKTYDLLTIFVDGGARGNPGPAAIGVVISDTNGQPVEAFGRRIGVATNNTAEYRAVIAALEFLIARQLRAARIEIHLDSQVVTHQLLGNYRVKQAHLAELLSRVRQLERQLTTSITYRHIPRSRNEAADRLVNRALDSVSDF